MLPRIEKRSMFEKHDFKQQQFHGGTSHVTTKQGCSVTALVDIQNVLREAPVTHSASHTTRVRGVCMEAENSTV